MQDFILKLGISSCLLGNKVRYDGQHKYDSWLVEELGKYVEFIPVCPEVECGLSVPREAMRLIGTPDDELMITINTKIDHTTGMLSFCKKRIKELKKEGLCGYVFKSKSPSCGMERVKLYPASGGASNKTGIGLFAGEFIKAFPGLPVEEEGRLHDPELRENFIERLFVMHRWLTLLTKKPQLNDLISFHTKHKLLLMAHSPAHYRSMGKLVAEIKSYQTDDFLNLYYSQLIQACSKSASRSKHQNVMLHILGYFKQELSASEKAELLEIIDLYKAKHYPLVVPITLINHYARKYEKTYLQEQYYLNPHPLELNLRNHV